MKKIFKSLLNMFYEVNHGSIWLTFWIVFLNIFSCVMITSATLVSSTKATNMVINAFVKSLIICAFCFVLYILASHIFSIPRFRRIISLLVVVVIGGCLFAWLYTLVIYGSGGINGAFNWIVFGGFSVQPSEFAKPLMIIMIATQLCDIRNNMHNGVKRTAWGIIKTTVIVFVSIVGIVVLLQRDLGTAVIICMISFLCFLIPSNSVLKKAQKYAFDIIVVVVVVFLILMNDKVLTALQSAFPSVAYVFNRFRSVIDPTFDITNASRELFNSLYAIATGGWKGVGLGNSIEKYGYINATESDYIFSVIVEELGLLGIAMVFVPYFFILSILIGYALKCKKESEKTILMGTAVYLFAHMFLNIGGVSGLVPLTGIPLLMVSSAGSSLMSIMITLGCCQRVISDYKKERMISQ